MFTIPSLDEISESNRQAINAEVPGANAHIFPSFLYAFSKALALMIRPLYLRLSKSSDQIFAASASPEFIPRHANEWGLARKPASFASGQLEITAAAALVITAGQTFTRTDGEIFETVQGASFALSGIYLIDIVSIRTGKFGNTAPFTLFQSIPNATLRASEFGIVGGSDIESDNLLRGRVLFRKRNPPATGSVTDYMRWCMEVPGVTRAFVFPTIYGPGTVGITCLFDNVYPNGIPITAAIARVGAYLDSVAPAGAVRHMLVPVAVPINIHVSGILPASQQTLDNIRSEIREMFFEKATVSRPYDNATFSKSWIGQAVSNAIGEYRHVVMQPTNDVTIPGLSIAVPGSITLS